MAPNLFPNLRHRGIKGLDYGVRLETKLESFARRRAILFGMFATISRRSALNCPAVKRMFVSRRDKFLFVLTCIWPQIKMSSYVSYVYVYRILYAP